MQRRRSVILRLLEIILRIWEKENTCSHLSGISTTLQVLRPNARVTGQQPSAITSKLLNLCRRFRYRAITRLSPFANWGVSRTQRSLCVLY